MALGDGVLPVVTLETVRMPCAVAVMPLFRAPGALCCPPRLPSCAATPCPSRALSKAFRQRSSPFRRAEIVYACRSIESGRIEAPLSRRAAIASVPALSALGLVVPKEAVASKLGPVGDRVWEAMGGGPADLVFPDAFVGAWEVVRRPQRLARVVHAKRNAWSKHLSSFFRRSAHW